MKKACVIGIAAAALLSFDVAAQNPAQDARSVIDAAAAARTAATAAFRFEYISGNWPVPSIAPPAMLMNMCPCGRSP